MNSYAAYSNARPEHQTVPSHKMQHKNPEERKRSSSQHPRARVNGQRREFKAFLHRHNVRREGIIAPALIRSRNYHPIIHYDRDCWLTVVGAMDGSPGIVTRDADHPVYCFVFPNLGVDTTLRHGDVVLFNPLYYHGATDKFANISHAWIYSAYFSMKTGAFQWVPMG